MDSLESVIPNIRVTTCHLTGVIVQSPYWILVGDCKFGEDCTHEHIGEAGSLRHLHCDDDGVCLHYKKGDCNRGAECKFDHPEGASAEHGVVQARSVMRQQATNAEAGEAGDLADETESDTDDDEFWTAAY